MDYVCQHSDKIIYFASLNDQSISVVYNDNWGQDSYKSSINMHWTKVFSNASPY
jgi:hypothetical protein